MCHHYEGNWRAVLEREREREAVEDEAPEETEADGDGNPDRVPTPADD